MHKKLKSTKFNINDKDTGYKKTVNLKTFKLPNGIVETFFVDEDNHSVQVFAITNDNSVICVKQWRPGTEEEHLELPGGGLDSPDEDPLEAGLRELKEEVGFTPTDSKYITGLPYSPYSTGIRHCVIATGCQQTHKQDLDPNEFLSVVLVPFNKFRELMKTGKVRGFELGYMALDKLGLL